MSKIKKIFVETNEEIIFTLENIRKSDSDRVILIVPQNASLVSSAVSLKILSREMLNTDKYAVIISEDQTSQKLCEKADLVVRSKISDIDKNTWLQAKELKERLLHNKAIIKKELLGERQVTDTADSTSEIKENNVKAIVLEDDEKNEDINNAPAITKPRLPAKIVRINGIPLVAGGSVDDYPEILAEKAVDTDFEVNSSIQSDFAGPKTSDWIEDKVDTESKDDDELPEEPFEDEEKESEPVHKQRGLLGKDLGSMTSGRSESRPLVNKKQSDTLQKFISVASGYLSNFMKSKSSSKYLIGAGAFLILIFFVSYFFFSSVTLSLTFDQEEVRISELISASPDITEIDLNTLTIPAIKITKSESTSRDGTPTGIGETGDTAAGLIDIHNLTDSDITLNKGAVLTDINSLLKYKLNENVVVPHKDSKGNGRAIDVSIVASTFGEKYNIIGKQAEFSIEGYTTDELNGRSFRDITGGTTEETTVVSQEDIDALKATLDEELKHSLSSKLEELISVEDVYLEGSETFQEVSFKSSANAGDDVDSFTIDFEISITAMKVLKSDLIQVGEEIARLKQGSTQEADVDIVEPQILNVTVKDNKATFELVASADIKEYINSDSIKEEIKGMKVSEAKEYLRDLDGLNDFRLRYSPKFVPFFMQKIPDDVSKIEVIKD